MIKKFTKFLLLLFILGLGLGALAQADVVTDTTPCAPVVASGSAALYVADNDDPRIRVLGWSGMTWSGSGYSDITLSTGEKCYGLAVNSAGDKLYASISNDSASKVMVYDLDGTGAVVGETEMSGSYPTGSSPSGLALNESANRLYVADNGLKGMRIYNTSTNAQTAYVSGMSDGHVGVAYLNVDGGKVFVTNKGVTGRIHVYDVSGDTLAYDTSITNANLVYPAHILAADNQVYVAVNAYAGIDVQVYDATSHAHVADVSNSDSITGRYGHVAIALTPSGDRLIFKKAVDAIQTSSYLFTARTDNLSTVIKLGLDTTDDKVNKSDGIVVSLSDTKIAVSNSPTGSVQIVAQDYSAGNHEPEASGLQQYKMDGTTEIAANGTTDQASIIAKFTYTDDEGDNVTPQVRYWNYYTEDQETGTIIDVPEAASGTEFSVPIPETGSLPDASYSWQVRATDGTEYCPWSDFPPTQATPDFTVDTINDPPTAFNKTSPADGADECCDVNLQWTASTDPDVLDTLTYTVYVYNEGDCGGAIVYTNSTTGLNQPIPLGTLTEGQTYEWNVSVTDGTNIVWADAGETDCWSFNYIEGIVNPGNPWITETSPVDAATDINIDAAVTITFNESIQSSTFTYTIAPAVTGDSISWNPTHTVATIAHDDFAMTTPYTITVTNADDVDESLPLTSGPVPNPFTFTTGTGSGSDPVINITITRDADTPGSDITITWDTDPAGLGIDVYEYICTYDEPSESYDRYFPFETDIPTDWTAVDTNVTIGTYTISSAVGDGTARYYKLIPNGDTLGTSDLTEEVVAKFDIAVGPSDTEPERFFISIPIEVADTSVTSIIGGQVEETDMILSFDIDKNVTDGSMYSGGMWDTFPGAIGPITNMEAGYPYGYYTPTAKYITAVGMVPETDYNRTLDGGATPVSNWLANPYPMPVAIADTGLNSSSHVTDLIDIVDAAAIYHFDADAILIDTTNGMAFHYPSATEWYEGTLTASSPLQMVPGKGYMFTEPVQSTFSWALVKPY